MATIIAKAMAVVSLCVIVCRHGHGMADDDGRGECHRECVVAMVGVMVVAMVRAWRRRTADQNVSKS